MVTQRQAPQARVLLYDGVYTLGGRVLRTLLAIALGVLTARALGPYQRGLYALPTAVYTGLVLSVFTGIQIAVSYFMLKVGAGREILRPALITAAIFTLLGAVPVVAAAVLGHNNWAVLPSVLILPASAAGVVMIGYAAGTKQIRWQTTYAVASTGALLAGMGAALLFFAHTAAVAVTAFVIVNIVIAVASLFIVFRDAAPRRGAIVRLRPFALYALRAGLVTLVTVLNYRADLYVVAALASAAVLGQYAVAISAAEGLLVVTQVAAIVTSPHVGAMEPRKAADMTATSVRATLVITVPICAAVFGIAPYAVHLLYGNAYMALVPALRILLIAVLILSVGSPISNFFALNRGKPEVSLASAMLAAGICVWLSWLLVPRIGMAGAAIATAVAYALGEGVRISFFISATGTGIGAILIPTQRDLQAYVSMAKSVAYDAMRRASTRKIREARIMPSRRGP